MDYNRSMLLNNHMKQVREYIEIMGIFIISVNGVYGNRDKE